MNKYYPDRCQYPEVIDPGNSILRWHNDFRTAEKLMLIHKLGGKECNQSNGYYDHCDDLLECYFIIFHI